VARGIREPKRHYVELEMSIAGSECCFVTIMGGDHNLVIAACEVDFAENLGVVKSVKELIDTRGRA
jgi:hypothetical protein